MRIVTLGFVLDFFMDFKDEKEMKEEAEEYWQTNTIPTTKEVYKELPREPFSKKEFKRVVNGLAEEQQVNLGNGVKSNNLYKSSAEVQTDSEKLASKANGIFFKSNPLHFDMFPGNCQMEAEITQICVNMFKGTGEACGLVDSSEGD
mmetsp:Transcript_31411/g.27755  ORF Transcript_31411/g.27755 Transcript_31411/m.27755 type:complete len:147 (+) Transcript_31411:183-623(+)